MKINNKQEFDKQNIFGLGKENTAFAQYFIGNSYLNPLTVTGENTSNEWCEPVDEETYKKLA